MDQHRSVTTTTKRQNPKKAGRALKKFTLFPKLPPELRDMMWNIAAPGPRIVTVDAGECFNLNTNTFKMRFASDNKVHGMLRACRESRQIMLRLLPIRLPSKYWKKELRIGHHDVLSITKPEIFFEDLEYALEYELPIPVAISQIRALCFWITLSGHFNVPRFVQTVRSASTLHNFLFAFKSLQTVIFCISSEDKVNDTIDEDSFPDFTTDFDPKPLDTCQCSFFRCAKAHEAALKKMMQEWKDEDQCNALNIPEVKIVAKGWPLKPLPASEETEEKHSQ
ncbi:hypothetical protein V8E51_003036 [Hyaloscypha variabilis]